ncbi:L,D-transpeptidase [Acinetobacter apis]|uniref:Lipoprotein-anchoring transpeptidase ErfK/SrfK n=1 Tax=Acinetobacter apis TaxID=1229165 RepID=A0A217EF10_9GAMM|nr:L,D-transpeptidase family protein [Acinetobacter apis]SNQ28927.1 Lipoprotein-anchoring transpeptidase ErfK/SrfK [Acinetobacter apis]
MFVRSLLAVSLSYLMLNSAFAASEVAQSVSVTSQEEPTSSNTAYDSNTAPLSSRSASEIMVNTETASDATPVAASEGQMTTQEQSHFNEVTDAVQTIDTNAERQTSHRAVSSAEKRDWSLDNLNRAEWYPNIGKGQFPIYARAQVMLNNTHASPGAIDGSSGKNTLKAIASFQQIQGLPVTGALDQATWDALVKLQGSKPTYIEYTITESDLKGPYAKTIPHDYALQSKMKGLYYTRVTEMLGEKFHMDEAFLKQLNPNADFNKLGQKIIVTSVRNNLPEDIHLIVAHKGAKQLYLFNSKNQMVGSFPATIGSTDTPSPEGTYRVTNVTPNPWYSYSPSNFVQGKNLKPLSLPPGPNAPVGNIWIGLSKKSFGIHGTPQPSLISKTASHGCIRLTNWDANDLGRKVKSGTIAKFVN